MELTTHQKTVKYTVYCLVIAVAGLLQNTPGLFWQIGSARCFLLLPVTLLLVMGERELPAALLGLFAGCVWDLHAAKSAGVNALFFMLLCVGVSAVMERYIRSTFVTHMLFALPAPFLYGLLYWLCFILIKGVDGGTNTLFTFYLPCALYTAVVAPILWFLLRPLRQRLNRKALQ